MLRDLVRGVVVVATEVAEEAGKRAVVLLEQLPPVVKRVETLAGEAVTAGRAGIDLAVGVTRAEAEKVFEKVGDQVVKVGVVLSYLEKQLVGGAEAEKAPEPEQPQEPRAAGLFDQGWEQEVRRPEPEWEPEPELEEEPDPGPDAWFVPGEDEEPEPDQVVAAPVQKAAKKAAAKKTAPAKKTAAKKTAVKKTVVKRTATVKKSTARKAAPAKKKPADD
ncbi:hypothetical protein [Kitasatospora sp. NPDC004289]